jgi:hypothetical protein
MGKNEIKAGMGGEGGPRICRSGIRTTDRMENGQQADEVRSLWTLAPQNNINTPHTSSSPYSALRVLSDSFVTAY